MLKESFGRLPGGTEPSAERMDEGIEWMFEVSLKDAHVFCFYLPRLTPSVPITKAEIDCRIHFRTLSCTECSALWHALSETGPEPRC